jgi:hypothetical protein
MPARADRLGHILRLLDSRAVRAVSLVVAVVYAGLSAEAINSLLSVTMPPEPGDICIVCNQPVGPDDRAYRVEGQRVPVHAGPCNARLQANPSKYLARIRPEGNQFLDAESAIQWKASWRWMVLGCYIVLGLMFGGLCGYAAVNRGAPAIRWFVAGMLLNVFAYLALIIRLSHRALGEADGLSAGLSKVPATRMPVECPACGKANHPAATRCSRCQGNLKPQVTSEVAKMRIPEVP